MKKTFQLTDPKVNVSRLVDSIKFEVKKYLKRERRKALPEGADFWDFNCRYGPNAEKSIAIRVVEINKFIDEAAHQKLESFYLEILAKPSLRTKTPDSTSMDMPGSENS